MAKDLISFNHPLFGQVRAMEMPDGQIGFVGKDVATALKYSNTRDALCKHVEDEDKTTVAICDSGSNYKTRVVIINESGLYSLVFGSKLPKAREFKHWVTGEVLPQIRQTGGYIKVDDNDDDNTILSKALMIAQKTLEMKDELIVRLQPKAQYSDEVLQSVTCLTVTQIAKEMGLTGNALNKLLCKKGIQYAQSGQYMLYAEYARQGLAQNRTHSYTNADGQVVTRTYLVWTERGRDFIHRLLFAA